MEGIDMERWGSMPLMEQMANIGSEVGRTRKWVEKGNRKLAESAFCRALELFDATIQTGRHGLDSRRPFLKEICRAREMFAGAYMSSDCSSLAWLDRYYGQFAMAVQNKR